MSQIQICHRRTLLAICLLLTGLSSSGWTAGKGTAIKKNVPTQAPVAKQSENVQSGPSSETSTVFQELNFNKTLVIEGKVEKPQVQFTLLKEPPPEKQIRFETSFLQNILKLDRENTFKVGESYGRD